MSFRRDTEVEEGKELVRKCLSKAYPKNRVVDLMYHSLSLMKKYPDKSITEILGEAMVLCCIIRYKK